MAGLLDGLFGGGVPGDAGGLIQQQPMPGAGGGGLLGAFDRNQTALGMMGLGMLSGQDNRDAFRLGMQGMMQGRQLDTATNQRRAVAQAIAADPSIPAPTRALLMQMEPSAALAHIAAERNYQRSLDMPALHNDLATGQTIVYNPRSLMGRIPGQAQPGAPGVTPPGAMPPAAPGAPGVAPPGAQPPPGGQQQPGAAPTGSPAVGGLPTLSGSNTFRAQVEQEQRRVLADQRGLTGAARERYIITGEFNPTDSESGARREFTSNTADQREILSRWNNMVQGASLRGPNGEPGTGAGDIAMVFSYMKMLDPQSTVREGEAAQARQAAGVPQHVLAMYNRLVGGGQLSAEARGQLLQAGDQIARQAHGEMTQRAGDMRGIAGRNGWNPDNVIGTISPPMAVPEGYRRAPAQQPNRQPAGAPPNIQFRLLP